MAIYHFRARANETLTDANASLTDDAGTDLPDDAAARDHARAVVQELKFKRQGMLGRDWSAWSMTVQSVDGVDLFSVPFTDVETKD
jgi:hypothetical protein